ncbi:MAG TPA: hypothetical protein VF576_13620, partial [Rubricoccaceae bacterium]
GPGNTDFQFTVRPETPGEPAQIDQIMIDVSGPNGTATGLRPGGLRPGASVVGLPPVRSR